ncbi:MAG: HAMP domain-containing histidine kinase [Myxococcales bacterium]|nr:HAMP domain-containing histidine kinase [Myxococcales bacterium]
MSSEKRTSPRRTLLLKLLVALVLPTVGVFSLFAYFAYELQREDLEVELGRRLQSVASAASTQLRGKYLVELVAGDEQEDNLYYQGGMRRLEEMRKATGVERLYVFDREFQTRLDTGGAPIGSAQFQSEIDRGEVGLVFENATSATSLLFEGANGRFYKAGYAPVYMSKDDTRVALAIGADAPAEFFERLAELRKTLIFYGGILVLVVAGVAILVGMRITKPVRLLAEEAERIGGGDLTHPIDVTSRDEIGFLAATMEIMRSDLRTRDERMQLMLAGIAHEVRNPLGGIELFGGILREDLEGDEEKLSHLGRIEKEIAYLKVVVESFLEYARRPAPELERVAMANLVREVADLEAGHLASAHLMIELNLEELHCMGDSLQLRRAALNLLQNAIQAGEGAGKPVVIALKSDGVHAYLSVSNHGAPIPEEARDRLFEPFFTTKQKGTGLGLAFVDEIAKDHGGTIRCTSDADDGTCFTLALPIASVQPTQSLETRERPS